jgi:hypothetical protein
VDFTGNTFSSCPDHWSLLYIVENQGPEYNATNNSSWCDE